MTLSRVPRPFQRLRMPWKDQSVVSVREEFVLRSLEPGARIAALCREYGISRKTGYKWIERFEKDGARALRDVSRRPRTSPLAVSGELVAEVVSMRNAHPTWGARKLVWALERSGAAELPSERTVNRILERCGLITKRTLRPKPVHASTKPKISVDAPNALWTADYKGWWRTGDLKRCEPLTVRDQFSRFVLAVHVARTPVISEAKRVFERLFETYGLPERILTDNGNLFVAPNSQLGLTQLSAWWLSLGIEHHRTRVGTPSDNGAHERLHRDMALELEAFASANADEQQRACDRWRLEFNNHRPHEALKMKTPAEVYRPSGTAYPGADVAIEYPEAMLLRTVSGRGFIRYRSRMIQISEALCGYTIGIDPRTGPPHEVWFAQRRIGFLNLSDEKPRLLADHPYLIESTKDLKETKQKKQQKRGNRKLSLERP